MILRIAHIAQYSALLIVLGEADAAGAEAAGLRGLVVGAVAAVVGDVPRVVLLDGGCVAGEFLDEFGGELGFGDGG